MPRLVAITIVGNQPASTGVIAQKYLIVLAGNQPSATGDISLMRAFIGLAGNQPAPGDLPGVPPLCGRCLSSPECKGQSQNGE